jgi:hypothetical protein
MHAVRQWEGFQMDGKRFDDLTRGLTGGHSRRGVLKGLGVAALGAAGLGRFARADAASGGNSACAHFCTASFPPGPARGACVSDAAHGAGVCYGCGPAAPAGSGAQLCGGVCVDPTSNLSNCGACGTVCATDVANASPTCVNGVCGFTCGGGLTACGDVCVDLTTVSNCGGCGNVCSGDDCNAPVCAATGCGLTPTNEGGSCNGGAGTCNAGVCVANPTTCVGITPGTPQCASDAECGPGQACQNGGCFTLCPDGSCDQSCTGCFCDVSIDGLTPACRDNDFSVGGCHHDSDCPPGSICDPFIGNNQGENLCTRPCPTP